MSLLAVALEGAVLAGLANLSLAIYVVWSWRLLRQNRAPDKGQGASARPRPWEVWPRLVLWAAVAGAVWPITAYGLGVFVVLLTYSMHGEELAIAQFFTGIAFFPADISKWLGNVLPGVQTNPGLALLHWALLTGLLLAAAAIEWLLAGLPFRALNRSASTPLAR